MTDHLITIHKNTYDSLQQELIELRQAVATTLKSDLYIEYTPAAIAIFDHQMRYLLASRRWREDYNLVDENIIGCSHDDVCPESSLGWQTIYQRCLAGTREKCEEDTLVRSDGTIDWVKWEINPWYEESGEVGGLAIFSEVITARKQAEMALVNSERRLRDIAANMPGVIFQFTNCNGNWQVDYISDFIWQLAGVTPAEMMTDLSCFFALVHPDDWDSYIASVVEAVENSTPWHYEGRLVKSNGEIRWWQGDSTPTRTQTGEIIFCGVMIDVTERKQTEAELQRLNEELEARVEERTAALQQTEARLQRLTDNMPGMLYEFRLKPDGTMFFPYVSSGCRELMERKPQDLQNDAALIFADIHPADVMGVREAIAHSAQTLQNFEYEWRLITQYGQQKWVKAASRTESLREGEIAWYGYLLDISEHKKAEQQLQQQAQFLQGIWEGVDYCIFVLDVVDDGTEFRYVKFNPAMLRISPIPLENFIGKTTAEALPPQMVDFYCQRYRECIQSKKSLFFEDSFLANDKETWWLINVTPLGDSNSCISQLVVTATDITERKQAEQERQMFVSLVENSSDFIGFSTLAGKPLFVNEAGLKLVDIDSLETAKTLHITDFILPEDREDIQQRILPIVNELGLWQGEYHFRNYQTHEAIPVDFNMFTVKSSETGKPLCLATVTRDIRERKQVEALLQEQEQFLRNIYDGVDQIIFVVDVLENFEFRFAGWNSSAEKSTGISQADAIGKTPEDLQGSVKGAAVRQRYKNCVEAGTSISYEECLTFHNQETWWLTKITPLKNSEGRIYRLVGTTLDITQRKYAEIQLQQQAENLEHTLRELQRTQTQLIHSEKMSSIGNMVAGVAHEINNPVNFIHGNLIPASEYAQDLLRLVELYQLHFPYPPEEIQEAIIDIDLDFLKEDLVKLLQSMRVGTQRIREIVLSLRNFSRLDEAEFKQVDIHEGIDSTLMILHNRLKAKSDHPEIVIVKDYSNLPLIDCYPGQLNQVFMNLISNAIDALEESLVSGNLSVATPSISIQTEAVNSNWIRIIIADNGVGIPPAILSKLFDPFFTTKSVGKGTGLGLSISYQIVVDRHNGKLSCKSTPGQGAEFVIEIPIHQ
ncbi:PAS domain-containing sensor histidine kinase [Anabaena subtropica]|uniref:histidine kinase n=1 Tax=Anabaena subtropica FACHB-260 TaxID=2692884 RepID=A0ABR8CUK2_9NOST|nr:PAS domain S-box protein [Anabaena subtropica]MBD2346079.1 PAS domain S-box protein [Anabaena subtropica FACHB-260]